MRVSRFIAALVLPWAASASPLEQASSATGTLSSHANSTAKTPVSDLTARAEEGGPGSGTVFNGKNVPPAAEFNGKNFGDSIKSGYSLVEFYSPYCGHCKQFAPIWQTFYEFYYTSEPLPQTPGSGESHNDLNSFSRYYDFKFAKVNCASDGDTCAAQKVASYPTIIMYKDGEVVSQKIGGQDLQTLSEWIEATLETIRPGSRLEGGPKLPNIGDSSVEVVRAKNPILDKATSGSDKAVSGSEKVASGLDKAASGSDKSDSGSDKSSPLTDKTRQAPLAVTTVVSKPQNPDGKSVDLTAETFDALVTKTGEPWFIKFYAPWCHHCQAMAPAWKEMAHQMLGELNVGEVNCEVEKKLCKDAKVRGFPTLVFFQGGERMDYEGLRGLGDLIAFANKAMSVRDGVKDVTAAEFEELEKKEEVIFLYIYDIATTSEDLAALGRLVLSLMGHAKIVKSSDPLLSERFKISTWPRLLVSRDGKPSYYNALAPSQMRDTRRVLDWMQTVWLPLVPELTASNAEEIMNGKLVVLGILNRERTEEFTVAKREIKNAALEWIEKQNQAFHLERQELRDAKQLRIEEAEDRNDQRGLRAAKSIRINMDEIERRAVTFAWVDGVFWERWIRTTFGISVADGEKVVINDEANHRYWDVTMTGNPIVPSRTSILETLPRIVANPPKIQPKRTTTTLGHVWWVIKGQLFEHPIVSICVSIAVLIGIAIVGRNRLVDARPGNGFIRLGEKSGMNGLLGGNAGGSGKFD